MVLSIEKTMLYADGSEAGVDVEAETKPARIADMQVPVAGSERWVDEQIQDLKLRSMELQELSLRLRAHSEAIRQKTAALVRKSERLLRVQDGQRIAVAA